MLIFDLLTYKQNWQLHLPQEAFAQCQVRAVKGQTDRQTDRQTDTMCSGAFTASDNLDVTGIS